MVLYSRLLRGGFVLWLTAAAGVLSACAVQQQRTPFDAGAFDAGALDGAAMDAGAGMDAARVDSGNVEVDMGVEQLDSGLADAGEVDAGFDAGRLDAGPIDAGAMDAGAPDFGALDLGAPDLGAPDSGPPDLGSDAGPPAPTAVVVVRVGDGSAARTNAATAVFLDEFSLAGSLITSVALPISATPISLSGSATSEGCLALSNDGHFLTLAGYGVAPGLASVAASMSATVPRVVARIDAALGVNVSSSTSTAYDVNNIRSAVTSDGTHIWTGGTAATVGLNGVQHISYGASTSTQVSAVPGNIRCVGIYDGQLYATSGSAGFTTVHAIGSGLPTTSGSTGTALAGMPTSGASPYGFVLLDLNTSVAGVDTAYIADDSAVAAGGGVQKYTFDGSVWTLATTFTVAATGCRGVTAIPGPLGVTVYATTAEINTNTLVSWLDTGFGSPSPTLIATAATNTIFRGVAAAPF